MTTQDQYTVFENTKLLCRGALTDVVLKVKRKSAKASASNFLIFSDQTGKSIDFNLTGSENDVIRRLEIFVAGSQPQEPSGPGRPRLGVVSREISLMPRHWEWLANQPGGASATLRKLIEEAKKKVSGDSDLKLVQERTYRFMSVLAGDFEGYEEAIRALYRKDEKAFLANMHKWPGDVRKHAIELAKPIFA